MFGSLVVPAGPVEIDGGAYDDGQEMPVAPSNMAQRPGSGSRPVIRSEVLERYRSRPSSAAILPTPRPNQP